MVLELERLQGVVLHAIDDDVGQELLLDGANAAGATFRMLTDPQVRLREQLAGRALG